MSGEGWKARTECTVVGRERNNRTRAEVGVTKQRILKCKLKQGMGA